MTFPGGAFFITGVAHLLFGPRLNMSHDGSDIINMPAIASRTDFTRSGSGSTVITGSVGDNVNLSVDEGSSSLIIRGNIGSFCKIIKNGNGALIIEGTVADDLKLTVYGQGSVTFAVRPPESVIRNIKNPGGVARITAAGSVLTIPSNRGYVHHNLGRPAGQQTLFENHRPTAIVERSAPATPQTVSTVDQYSEYTQAYIDTEARKAQEPNYKSIADRINELNLTEEEKPLFERFMDPITLDYFNDIPVTYNERHYDLSTVLEMYKARQRDPITRYPLRLVDIQAARTVLESLDGVIKELDKIREAAKKAAAQTADVEDQSGLAAFELKI